MFKDSRFSAAVSAVSSKTQGSPSKSAPASRRATPRLGDVPDTASSRRTSDGGAARPEAERVRVFVRVRPTRPEETPGGLKIKPSEAGVVIYREHASIPVSDYDFDRVLPNTASQSDVYQAAVRPIVEDVLNGYNGTVMAYGQTGAGKTFTLSSIKPDAIGMIPRAAAEIFSHIAQDTQHEYSVCLSYIQIYMELIQDLLRPESENLQIRENEGGVFISGVQQIEVKNIEQCLHLLQLGDRNRATAFTALNAHSSRSHAVVMLTVVKRKIMGGSGDAEIQRVKIGKLFMVDLAGSERLKKSKSTGLRATEAKSINLSLTTLGMCINARADPNATHVPFRDSKLTRLLQESLGGNAKTSLVIAVSDATDHVDETSQSLQFGVRAMCVKIQAVVNERVDYKSLHADLLAAMEGQDQRSALLEKSLLAKESELEVIHAQLREEKVQNERIIAALQQEREQAEEEKDRLLQEQQARLEAEQQHKQSLLQKLEETQVQTEGLRQQHNMERAELVEELEKHKSLLAEAAMQAKEARLQHELELDELRAEARKEWAQLRQGHLEERRQLTAQHDSEAAALRQQVVEREGEVASLKAKLVEALAVAEASMQQAEASWGARLSEAEAAAAEQLAAAQARIADREHAIAELRGEVARRDDEIVQLHETISGLEAAQARLEHHNEQLHRHLDQMEQQQQHLEAVLAGERERISDYQRQVAAYERSRMALAKSFFENKRLNDAARTIQRAYRQHRNRAVKLAQQQRQQALNDAHSALGSQQQQLADLERRRRANLAFSGQTLVGDSLNVLQDAVEGIITAFLLPARDLKTLQTVKQRVSHYGPKNPLLYSLQHSAASSGSMAGLGGGDFPGSKLARTSANTGSVDLIRAVHGGGLQQHAGGGLARNSANPSEYSRAGGNPVAGSGTSFHFNPPATDSSGEADCEAGGGGGGLSGFAARILSMTTPRRNRQLTPRSAPMVSSLCPQQQQ